MNSANSRVITGCRDLAANLRFFLDDAGFRVDLVRPADDPRLYVVERDGLRVELRRAAVDDPVSIVLDSGHDVATQLVAPNGSTVTMVADDDSVVVPPSVPSTTVVASADGGFGVGRAGMEYRDLLPDRWGGRFIASHIAIPEGGELSDWVHFHRIRFQMIFVAAGWVDVVYEDQGEPFRMVAGDCVLQPPEIRHRVLRSSPGLEVIEVGCPAEHDTLADPGLDLPNGVGDPGRDFGGQKFVRHIAASTPSTPWVVEGLTARDTGIGAATDGLAGAVVVSPEAGVEAGSELAALTHDDEFVLIVGLCGEATLDVAGRDRVRLDPRTSISLPPGSRWRWIDPTVDHEALVVSLSADAVAAA